MAIADQLQQKINFKTKPLGSLGTLEQLALQIGVVQNSLSPVLNKPTIVIFAGDHGIANEGVSAYPQAVTFQMVMNFLQGGAAINVFSEQNQLDLKIVDAGVNFKFDVHAHLIDAKIGFGTKSFLRQKAMSHEELAESLVKGEEIVNGIASDGCNVIGFGEMGIGNTSSAAMIMSYLCDLPVEKCIGRGTGLNDEQMAHKLKVLSAAQSFHGNIEDPREVLQTFGGYEIAQMCGAMLSAYERNMLILVDGFIASSAFLVANKINPSIVTNAIFCHLSDEFGHKSILSKLGVSPVLSLNMRLGEGTGCALAYPIIESAVAFLNNMASFESAGVSNKEV